MTFGNATQARPAGRIQVLALEYARILLALVYLINGINWFYKIIAPYPSISDFVHFMPTDDVVGMMIERSFLFHLGKGLEVVTGLMLLANRMVPLALVASMPVTAMVFFIDVFKPEMKVRSTLMGVGSMTLNVTLLLAFYHHYRPMMNWRATLTVDPAETPTEPGDRLAHLVGVAIRAVLPVLTVLAVILGTAMVIWLVVLMAQYAIHPQGLAEIRPLAPRV